MTNGEVSYTFSVCEPVHGFFDDSFYILYKLFVELGCCADYYLHEGWNNDEICGSFTTPDGRMFDFDLRKPDACTIYVGFSTYVEAKNYTDGWVASVGNDEKRISKIFKKVCADKMKKELFALQWCALAEYSQDPFFRWQ